LFEPAATTKAGEQAAEPRGADAGKVLASLLYRELQAFAKELAVPATGQKRAKGLKRGRSVGTRGA